MKKLVFTLVVASAMCGSFTNAQDKVVGAQERPAVSNSSLPDWQSSYQEEYGRDYIRRRAQEKTAARQARIEGMRWLGHSPARPVVTTTPHMGSVPSWTSFAPSGYWGPAFWPSRGPIGAP